MDPSAFMGSPAQFPQGQFPGPNPQQQAPQPQQQPPQQMQQHQHQHPQHQQQHPHQQPQPPQMQGMPNGAMRNPSPSPFPNNAYQTSSVIPSKRPRPAEDGAAGSPRPNPNLIPTSRSETPPQHGNFNQFNQAAMAQPGQGQAPQYPHLQANGSTHATPSPVMANQMRPGSVPQRVSTASPHPFSPSAPQFGGQASPVPSEHGTPQPNQFVQGLTPGFNPNFNPSPSPGPHPPMPPQQQIPQQMMQQQMGHMPPQMGQPPNMLPPGMQPGMQPGIQPGMHPQARTPSMDQNAAYQMRLQQQQHQQHQQQQQQQQQQQMHPGQPRPMQHHGGQMMNPQMAAQQGMGRGMMAKGPMPPNGQMPPGAMPPGAPRPQQGPQSSPMFMKGLQSFMNSRGLRLDPNPMIGDRQIPLVNLFHMVQSRGGFRLVCTQNMWPQVAAQLGFRPDQLPVAAGGLRTIYEHNLLKFEDAYTMQKQQKHQQAGMHPGQPGPPRQMPQGQMGQRPLPPGQPHPQMPPGTPFRTPTKQGQPQPPHGYPAMNGFQDPHAPNGPHPSTPGHPQRRDSIAMGSEYGTPGPHHPTPSPAAAAKRVPAQGPGSKPPEHYEPHEYKTKRLQHYGGVPEFDLLFGVWGNQISAVRPDIPRLQDLGEIHIHALSRSIQSGLHSEVRTALDTLATVTSSEHAFLHIGSCDDLLEVLIECGEEQLDFLAEHTAEVSDEIQLTPYEDVARAYQLEVLGVRKEPAFGTLDHRLDRAVEKLICITTILRNLSFTPILPPKNAAQVPTMQPMDVYMYENHQMLMGLHPLGDDMVVKFFCDVIRYLGTRTMLLRTHANTLDFMKDLVTLLSNIANYMEIPGREQAMCLLQFILAFAPTPVPTAASTSADDAIVFAPYEPSLHPYLPAALDALAKLFSRDDPNRAYYKTIFALETQGPAPYDLLTRAFGLAISPIPDQTREFESAPLPPHVSAPPHIEHRKPFIMQGLLAADILATMAPGHEVGLARAWLSSPSGFGQNILRFITTLRNLFEPLGEKVDEKGGRKRQVADRSDLLFMMGLGISLLRRLVEKSRDPSDPIGSVPRGILPTSEMLFDSLSLRSAEWKREGVLSMLMAYARLDD
jgi:SWI/SNF chromatin-remodeling complex subunit SWI1